MWLPHAAGSPSPGVSSSPPRLCCGQLLATDQRGGVGAALLLGAGSGAAAHGAARAAWGVQLGGQSQTRVAVTRASEQTS